MPAAARQYAEYSDSTAVAEPDTAVVARLGHASPARDEWREAAPLLEHFQENARVIEKNRAEREKQVIRRARRMHRPLKLRWPMVAVGVWLFCLLVGVLWLNGLAQSSVRQARSLDAQIAQTRDEIERTQKKIAAQDSQLRLQPLASQMGWQLAEQNDFDDVTKPNPALKPQPASSSQPPANQPLEEVIE